MGCNKRMHKALETPKPPLLPAAMRRSPLRILLSALRRSARAQNTWGQGAAADMVIVCTAAPSLSSPQPFAVCHWQQVKVAVTGKGEMLTCLSSSGQSSG